MQENSVFHHGHWNRSLIFNRSTLDYIYEETQMGIYASKNKRASLSQAVSLINDEDIIAVGGNLSAREPMALIREMIRQGKHGLHSIGGAHGIDIDIMCAAGVLKKVQHSYVGFEADFGLAPNYRRGVEEGTIVSQDTDCVAVKTHLMASVLGLPFMPMVPVRGTELLKLDPHIKIISCPYTGDTLNALPAIKPDVAIIHAHKADTKGNVKIYPPYFADLLLVESAKRAIVSVEEIISEEEMRAIGANLPYYEITAIVEAPFGAHPTSCYPDYSYDRAHIAEYMKLAGQGEEVFRTHYMDRYIHGVEEHEEYIDLVGGREALSRLSEWNRDTDAWRSLLER